MGGLYFEQTRYISNSDLGALRRVMGLQDAELNCHSALAFGNLLDAKFTEAHKLPELGGTDDDLQRVQLMYEAGLADSAMKFYFDKAAKQHEVYKLKFKINHDGHELELPARCKFDFLVKALKSGADLKSTACTSQASFVDSVFWLGYDRAAAWYMDLAGLDTFMIIGISKTRNRVTRKHDVYKFAIKRGDEVYEAGRRKYSRLAFYYYYLIYNLQL